MVQQQKNCSKPWRNAKFYPFCEDYRDFCEKNREVMTGETSIVLTRKINMEETFIRDLPNNCKSIVGIDASQPYAFSMFQEMSTGLGGATFSDSFLKAYKASETKVFSLTSGLTVRTSSKIKNFLHKKPFSVNWDATIPFDKDLKDYQNLASSELDEQ